MGKYATESIFDAVRMGREKYFEKIARGVLPLSDLTKIIK